MQDRDTIDRRTFVRRTGVATGTLALAGCLGNDTETDEDDEDDVSAVPETVRVEDPPEAVYVPTHREAMRMLEPVDAGGYRLAPMLSYPHPFWLVAGDGAGDAISRESPDDGRGVHMMFVLWEEATGTVLPVDEGAQIRLERDGERVGSPRSPWAMISQEMGFHFGDNVPLPEDGTYTVEVTVPPLSTRKTGELEGRLEERETATFEFVYDDAFREEVVGGVDYLDESLWGERGALEPMDHGGSADEDEHHEDGERGDTDEGEDGDQGDEAHGHDDWYRVPYSALPGVGEYPGTLLVDSDGDDVPESTTDLPRSGDAAFLETLLESESRLADGDDRYLLVSPRTPYNRVPLADMSLSATVERGGSVVAESPLEQTIDGEYDLHYGASLSSIRPGDSVTVTIDSPPQVARHQGYETAFLEMPPLELTVPEER
ncbi:MULTISPECIES: DUF7350 domain-containing protein [Natrialbaceae]|uniref:DUF7350 domain-containing protein n=1 Tax=Natrialbaceae TaxID=1644061 RepID=UPI00207C42D7|nr:hypothetical protein [Natronococcus sp. CG52]